MFSIGVPNHPASKSFCSQFRMSRRLASKLEPFDTGQTISLADVLFYTLLLAPQGFFKESAKATIQDCRAWAAAAMWGWLRRSREVTMIGSKRDEQTGNIRVLLQAGSNFPPKMAFQVGEQSQTTNAPIAHPLQASSPLSNIWQITLQRKCEEDHTKTGTKTWKRHAGAKTQHVNTHKVVRLHRLLCVDA